MNVETRAQANIRKRLRHPNFDLDRSILHTHPKQRKTGDMRDKVDNNRGTNDPQFADLSATINSGPSTSREAIQHNTVNVSADLDVTPEVREMVSGEAMQVQKSLEEKVKMMVQKEMTEIRKSIAELTNSMVSLTRMNQTPNAPNNVIENANQPVASRQCNPPTISENSSDDSVSINGILRNINPPRGCITAPASQNIEQSRIRIDKLGVVFDGVPHNMSVDDFIFRLEHLQCQYQIPWTEVLRDFHLLMSGAAREWYWLFIKTRGVVDWPSLRHALIGQFQSSRSNFEILRELVERRQQVNESIDNYFHTMNQIRSRLVQPIPEYDMIKIMKKNIRDSLARIIYPIAVSSVEQLRIECHEAERNFLRKELRNQIPQTRQPNRYVNEIYDDQSEEEDIQQTCIDEITRLNSQQKQVVCWNCRQPGHIFIDCPVTERNLFCYKCGRPNVITPKCPVCQSGNSHRGLGAKGDPRPPGSSSSSKI